jgi:uncharacterized protein (TIGR02452 family)
MTLKVTATEILAILEAGSYRVGDVSVNIGIEQKSSLASTRLYRPADLEQLRGVAPAALAVPRISVVDGTSQVIAQRRPADGEVALINFASARNPCGGFLNGAKAQEEDLCRCSGLYPCLLTCMEYYEKNREQRSLLSTDYAIDSPRVPFFKIRGTGELLETPFLTSVITAPAPNSGPYLRENPQGLAALEKAFAARWEIVLCIARDQNIRRLLLGAWGGGAFGGDPEMAARTAANAVATYGNAFDEIVFAIPGKGGQSKKNLEAFQQEFPG